MMKNCPKYKLISGLLRVLNVPILKLFLYSRDVRASILHGLQPGSPGHPQDGHLEIFRPGNLRRHRA